MRTVTKKEKPAKRQSNKQSTEYYYARKLYFEGKIIPPSEVAHLYNSREIANKIKTEFNKDIPDNTIRRWVVTPDKDFEGRTWLQEWSNRLAIGTIKALDNVPTPEGFVNGKEPKKSEEDREESPMQKLSKLKEKSLTNDLKIATEVDIIVQLGIKEIADEYRSSKKIPWDKLTKLQHFHGGAKQRIYSELKDIEALEKRMDSEMLYGNIVALKDPQARERVRQVMLALVRMGKEMSEEDHEFIEHFKESVSTLSKTQEGLEINDLEGELVSTGEQKDVCTYDIENKNAEGGEK